MIKRGKKITKMLLCFLTLLSILFTSAVPCLDLREEVSAAGLSISQESASLIKGQSIQLSVSGSNKKVTWSSSDKKIASVDKDGYVVAKKAGNATIKAKVGKKTLSCKITVANEGLNYTDRTAYVGDVLQMEVLNAKDTVKWSSSKKSIATVNSKGKVTVKKKGTVTIKATAGKKTYTCKLKVEKASITRGQWMNELVKELKLSVPKKFEEYSFSDIGSNKYKNAIQLAYNCGIIPQTNADEFFPNAPATREFVAYTAVKGIGINTSTAKALTCKDKSKISYKEEVSKAIELGMLSLSKKNFNPTKEITKSNKTKTLKVVKAFVESTIVKENIQKVEYSDGVQLIEQATDYSVESTTTGNQMSITVMAGTDLTGVKAGDILVLPDSSNTESLAVKVDSISTDSAGNVSISGTEPKLEEVFESIDIEEIVTVELSDFVPNASVLKRVTINESNDVLEAELILDDTVLKGENLDSDPIKLGKDINKDFASGNVTGNITITAPELTAKIKANTDKGQSGLTIEQFMLSLSNKVVGTATVSGRIKEKNFYLGHLEAKLGKGFKAWLIFYAVFTADGSATIKCELTNTISLNYYNDQVTHPVTVTKSFEGTEAWVDAKLYLDTNLKVTWLGVWDDKEKGVKWDIEIAGLYLDIGAGACASAKVFDTKPKQCVDLTIYAYAAISLETEAGLGYLLSLIDNFPTSWTIYDNNATNPYKIIWHMEDGKRRFGACSHSEDVYTVTLNANGGKLDKKSVKVKANNTCGTLPSPTRNGYDFDGWYDARTGGNRISPYFSKITKSIIIYAHWKESVNVNVTFDANGGSELTFKNQVYKHGEKYATLPTVVKKNCEFLGWYTQKTGGKKVTANSIASRDNGTLYARWSNMSTTNGYWITKLSGDKKGVSIGFPVAYSMKVKGNTLTVYGGVGEYDRNAEKITSRKGYAWREYTIASDVKISVFDESVDEDEDDAWISIDRSDLKDEIAGMEKGTRVLFKLYGGKITEIIFME